MSRRCRWRERWRFRSVCVCDRASRFQMSCFGFGCSLLGGAVTQVLALALWLRCEPPAQRAPCQNVPGQHTSDTDASGHPGSEAGSRGSSRALSGRSLSNAFAPTGHPSCPPVPALPLFMQKCEMETLIVCSDHSSSSHARVLLGMCVLIVC